MAKKPEDCPPGLVLRVVDRGLNSAPGCELRDVYLLARDGGAHACLMHALDALLPAADRLAAWFADAGVPVERVEWGSGRAVAADPIPRPAADLFAGVAEGG